MKSKMISLLLAAGCLSASVAYAGVDYVAADSSRETRFCMIAAEGTRLQLMMEAHDQRTTISRVAKNITCNDVNITTFAYNVGNEPVYKKLAKYYKPHVDIYQTASLSK